MAKKSFTGAKGIKKVGEGFKAEKPADQVQPGGEQVSQEKVSKEIDPRRKTKKGDIRYTVVISSEMLEKVRKFSHDEGRTIKWIMNKALTRFFEQESNNT